MEIKHDQGSTELNHVPSKRLLTRLQRVYFGNWLRDYSQVRMTMCKLVDLLLTLTGC
jgi:hypothetical protein